MHDILHKDDQPIRRLLVTQGTLSRSTAVRQLWQFQDVKRTRQRAPLLGPTRRKCLFRSIAPSSLALPSPYRASIAFEFNKYELANVEVKRVRVANLFPLHHEVPPTGDEFRSVPVPPVLRHCSPLQQDGASARDASLSLVSVSKLMLAPKIRSFLHVS